MERCEVDLSENLKRLEEELLAPEVRKSRARLREILAEDFREFGSSGRVLTRDEIVEALAVEGVQEFHLYGFVAERVGERCVLVTYQTRRIDDEKVGRESLRSSIWVERDTRWQMVFHQGTKVDGSDA